MIKKDRFIAGIYNYCDRWCEHCAFRFRCFLYAKEEKRIAKHRAKGEDPNDWKVIIKDIEESFTETKQLLYQTANEMGLDLNALAQEDYESFAPSDHPLMKIAQNYYKLANKFLKKLSKALNKEMRELSQNARIISPLVDDLEMF